MKKLSVILGLVAVVLVLGACELPITYSDQPLEGTGGAAGWTVASGTIDGSGSVDLEGSIAGTSIMFTIDPLVVGEVRLKFDLFDLAGSKTITYYDGATNYIMADGAFEVTAITSTTVSGRLQASDSYQTFDGTFELTIIP